MKYLKIYPEKLKEFILNNPQYIPNKLKDQENLKLYHRYWLVMSERYLKVQEIFQVMDVEYYTVKYPDLLFGSLSYPIEEPIYEIQMDYSNIRNIRNMVNNKRSYSGAQIKYWFFVHIENDIFVKKFEGFESFIDPNSKSLISDDKYYFLYGENVDGVYRNCKVSLDKAKLKRK